MIRVIRAIGAFNDLVGRIISIIIILIIFILTYETLMRYIFNSPSTWANYLSNNLTAPYFFLGGAYTLLHNGHVSMDVFYNRFPSRMKKIVNLLTAPIFFIFIGILLWKGTGLAWNSITGLENSGPPLYWPTYPIKLFVPLGCFLFLLQGLAKLIHELNEVISGRGNVI